MMRKKTADDRGFSLIELLISMVVASIVLVGIYSSFDSQAKSNVKQQQIVDVQQNLRGALYLMEQDIRMAGCDPAATGLPGIVTAGPNSFRFTLEIHNGADDDADTFIDEPDEFGIVDTTMNEEGEDITFILANDADADGITDGGAAGPLNRTDSAIVTPARVAEDIRAIGFAYAYDNDGDGQQDTTAGGNVIWAIDSDGDNDLDTILDTDDDGDIDTGDTAGGVTLASLGLPTNIALNTIRAVRVWVLARTRNPLRETSRMRNYVVGNKVVVADDRYQPRLMTTTIKCRNMGI
jgi:type IV pilus assembly protein PilW